MDTPADTKGDWVARAEGLALQVRNVIGAQSTSVGGQDAIRKLSPRNGQLLYQFGSGSQSDVDAAVASARRAFSDGRWSKLPSRRRSDVLNTLAGLLAANAEEFALLESLDTGKPISDALGFDVPHAVAMLRFGAAAGDKLASQVYGVDANSLSFQSHRPLGVVVGVSAGISRSYSRQRKSGPPSSTGNTLVLKPSELTSLSAARLAELALQAGVPEGVLNVIHGGGSVGAGLARHGDVDMITFTGSSRTGKALLIASGESNMKRLMLECGGKAPNIVFDDAPDLAAVADAVVARAFWNQGQVCTASSRLLVHADIKEELLGLVIERASASGAGRPIEGRYPLRRLGECGPQGQGVGLHRRR